MAAPERDPYAILGVRRDADRDTLAMAYRRLAREHHPDTGAASDRAMADINWAWRILSDPHRRRDWDAHGEPSRARSAGHWTAERPAPHAWQPPAQGWAASGDAWAGDRAERQGRRSLVGCLPISVVVLVLAMVVLFAALGSGRVPGIDPQATVPPAGESTAP